MKRLVGALAAAALLVLPIGAMAQRGGGGGHGGTPSGTYSITVTGTDGNTVHNSSVNLTVD